MSCATFAFINFEKNWSIVLEHQDTHLIKMASNLIPYKDIEEEALSMFRSLQKQMVISGNYYDEAAVLEITFLKAFLKWFRNDFFTWKRDAYCSECHQHCTFVRQLIPTGNNSVDAVEVSRCKSCKKEHYFNRYKDTRMLLDTRTGRCQEHTQVCALMCKALNYACRMVIDINDHMWVEVYSDLQKRWIHIDPSEEIIDKPLLYEKGWNKVMSYVIAIGDYGVQDVTWRYTADHLGLPKRRQPRFDNDILERSEIYLNKVLSTCTPDRRRYILNIVIRELVELLVVNASEDKNYSGRQSGSEVWKRQRGEASMTIVDYLCTIPQGGNEINRFSLYYCCNKDAYMLTNFDDYNFYSQGWSSLCYAYQNIMRKEESDWKMSYLAREFGHAPGVIRWKFDLSATGYKIVGITIIGNFFTVGSGQLRCLVSNSKNNISFFCGDLLDSSLIADVTALVEVVLDGGTGPDAWQHAQLARQSLGEISNISFGITLHLIR